MQSTQQVQNTQQQNKSRYQYEFREDDMRRYFFKPAGIFLWLLVFGSLLLLMGLIGIALGGILGVPIIILGGILFAVGGIPLLLHYTGLPTDDEYVKWVIERSQPLYKKALERLHLDESQCESIIEIQGGFSSLLQLTKKFPENEIAVKRRPNGFRLYSINICTYIFLTKDDIAIYTGYINALAQSERFEDADHYYYKDIVGVSTSGPIYIMMDGPSQIEIQRQGFFLRVSNGETVGTDYARKVVLGNAENRVQTEGVDEVVAILLSLLRDHNVTLIQAHRTIRDIG